MAGIGFTLKRLFSQDTFTGRAKAYAYSAFVAAGPWISAVVVVNILQLVAQRYIVMPIDRFLFMVTIVYSFVFSQIITAPWQLIITRFVADKLFEKEYDYLQPSFMGASKIVFVISFVVAISFYATAPLPMYYKYMAGSLFLVLTLMWIVIVYLGATKSYGAIANAFLFGGIASALLLVYLLRRPIPFDEHLHAGNMLFAYLVGVIITHLLLVRTLFETFTFGNKLEFDFLRYLSKVPSLFFVGLFYTAGIWVDTILTWFSVHGRIVHDTFRYAPLYDHAKFLAYLTIIPTTVLFLVYVETEFYDRYKKYYQVVRGRKNFAEISDAKDKLTGTIYRLLVYLLERQVVVTLTIMVLAEAIFVNLGFSMLLKDIFRICALAALCNAMLLVVLLVLLYFEARREALGVSLIFFLVNLLSTSLFMPLGDAYLGLGLFLAALAALLVAVYLLVTHMKNLTYKTFASQPFFLRPPKGVFIALADRLNAFFDEPSEQELFPRHAAGGRQ